MSNMLAQAPDNNQGPWAALEGYLRTLTDAGNELYIVSGPAGVGGTGTAGFATSIVGGRVEVPASTWKVVMILPAGENDLSRVTAATQTFAVNMPNTQGIRNNDWHIYKTTVRNIETLTNLNFFSNVPGAVQNSIENGIHDGNPVNDLPNPPGTGDQSVQAIGWKRRYQFSKSVAEELSL